MIDALLEAPLEAIVLGVRSRRVSARALVDGYLDRIARHDRTLGAFREVMADAARREADALDARIGDDTRPLLGVPIAIKDTIDVRGVATRGGTASDEAPACDDAEIVRRLRVAGAVIVGKTHLPEIAAWPFTHGQAWGRTRNPWALDRDPGGSSGGSAVAVAAGLCAAAIGDDLGGSIRVPAACTGTFGFKPQRGRVPTDPHVGRIQGLGTYGPITRYASDAARLLDVLAAEPTAPPSPRPLRIGVSLATPVPGPTSACAREALDDLCSLASALGHSIVEVRPRYSSRLVASFFARYLRGMADEHARLAEPDRTEARTRALARLGRAVPARALAWAHARGLDDTRQLDALFDDVDVLATPMLARAPVHADAWRGQGVLATLAGVARYSPYAAAWNVTGHPACAVPLGLDAEGLPVAVQLVGPFEGEGTLLALAVEIERARPFPRCPILDDAPDASLNARARGSSPTRGSTAVPRASW